MSKEGDNNDNNNSSNNNHTDDIEVVVDLKECRKRAHVAFWKVANDGVWRLFEQAPTVWSGVDGRYYRADKKMVSHHLEPLYWGVFVTLFLFTTFRVSGSRMYTRFRDQLWAAHNKNKNNNSTNIRPTSPGANGHANTSANASAYTQKKPPQPWKSYLDQQAEKTRATQQDLLDLPADVLLSVACGCSSVLWLSQPTRMRHDFVAAPLCPGKSVVAEIFCPDMEHAFRRHVDARLLTPDIIQSDDTMGMFFALVKNCRTRADFVAHQQQQGVVKRPDVIPYPGLDGVRRR
jgi:hypothetical protein